MRFSSPAIRTSILLLLGTIALWPLKAEARVRLQPQSFSSSNVYQLNTMKSNKPRDFRSPIVTPAPGVEPTCYVKMGNGPVKFLDHLCGVNDFKPDRRRNPNELDKDGVSFVMKENFQAIRELRNKLGAAQQRLENEMPISSAAKQLMAEQKALFNQYGSVKTKADSRALEQRIESNQRKINQDPTIQKSHEMMRKLYQQGN